MIAVLVPNTVASIRTAVFWSVGTSAGARSLLQFNGAELRAGGRRLDADSFDSATGGTIVASQPIVAVARLDYANATAIAYSNSVPFATDTSFLTAGLVSDTASQAAAIMNSTGGSLFYSGTFAELLTYDRALTDSERRKIELHLARKWGITLPPTATNPEAVDWINAVYAAGSSVNTATAKAVDDFVSGCKADGIWSAIKACCVLCGPNTLAGALVPLVGTAPTNNNFVSGDYNRLTGLVGNASTKFLDTNRAGNADPQDDVHVAVYATTANSGTQYYAGSGAADGKTHFFSLSSSIYSNARDNTSGITSGANVAGLIGLSRAASTGYTLRANKTNNTITVASTTTLSSNFHVFATSDAASARANGRIAFYSIGESLDLALLDTRASALITAIGAS